MVKYLNSLMGVRDPEFFDPGSGIEASARISADVTCLLADSSQVISATFEVAVSGMNRRRSESDRSEISGNFGHSLVVCSIRPEPESIIPDQQYCLHVRWVHNNS
jgi:hypothetical protein